VTFVSTGRVDAVVGGQPDWSRRHSSIWQLTLSTSIHCEKNWSRSSGKTAGRRTRKDALTWRRLHFGSWRNSTASLRRVNAAVRWLLVSWYLPLVSSFADRAVTGPRTCLTDYTFSNGLTLPKGTAIAWPLWGV